MLPVSVTAIVLRIIFQLKLADIVINITAGGPGGATDTVSSFIFREYRDRSNVGYGTMLAEVYLIIIIIFISLLLRFVSRWMQREEQHMTQPSRQFAAVQIMREAACLIYGALLLWAFICLFPIYWTISTSFKTAVNVTQGDIIPWVGRFQPDWKGWRSLGLSPDTIGEISTVRDEFLLRFEKQRAGLGGRGAAGGDHRLAGGLWAEPLSIQIRSVAEQGHLLLLPVAAHPAAGRPGHAISRALQGTGPARHASSGSSSSIR